MERILLHPFPKVEVEREREIERGRETVYQKHKKQLKGLIRMKSLLSKHKSSVQSFGTFNWIPSSAPVDPKVTFPLLIGCTPTHSHSSTHPLVDG